MLKNHALHGARIIVARPRRVFLWHLKKTTHKSIAREKWTSNFLLLRLCNIWTEREKGMAAARTDTRVARRQFNTFLFTPVPVRVKWLNKTGGGETYQRHCRREGELSQSEINAAVGTRRLNKLKILNFLRFAFWKIVLPCLEVKFFFRSSSSTKIWVISRHGGRRPASFIRPTYVIMSNMRAEF